jgi:hypothetical protein
MQCRDIFQEVSYFPLLFVNEILYIEPSGRDPFSVKIASIDLNFVIVI